MNLYPVPKEVIVISETPRLILLFKNSNFFMWIFFIVFLLGQLWFLIYFFHWLIVILTIGFWVFSIYPWLWISVATLKLRVDINQLTIEKKLLGLSKIEQIDRSDIKLFAQGENSKTKGYPRNWQLKLKTNQGKIIYLLAHQPLETSDWLGRVLADIYRVEFNFTQDRG